jgi:hypothetical protein
MKTTHFLILAVTFITVFIPVLQATVKFNFDPTTEGFFILHGNDGHRFELTDDLVPEDAPRLIWAMPRYPFRKVVTSSKCSDSSQPCLDFRWDKKNGRGFIRNTWPDGTKLVINLGRFKDSKEKYPMGLFIGGGLPPADHDYQFMNNEATGMTYFDGRRWYHVWCNSNEGLISPAEPNLPSYPTDWDFKGSWVRENDGRNLTIESRHRALLTNVPLDINRVLFYTTGDSHVLLSTELTNRGTIPVQLQYEYGDEPWVGDFGTSAGDVGWAGKEIFLREQEFDTQRYTYLGMFDYGNDLAGEGHDFTGIANFLEWSKTSRPDKAYLSNTTGGIYYPGKNLPLVSPANRFIGLSWGPRTLQPGESFAFSLAVGLAGLGPESGFPVKPVTRLSR